MEKDLKKIITDINRAFESGDLVALGSFLAENVRWNISGKDSPVVGKKEFLDMCAGAPFQDGSPKIKVTNVIVEGNRAAVESIIEAKTLSGKPYRQLTCDIYLFEGDKIKEMSSYMDTNYDKKMLNQ